MFLPLPDLDHVINWAVKTCGRQRLPNSLGGFCPVSCRGGCPSLHQFLGAEVRAGACIFLPRLASWTPIWCWTSCAATGSSRASESAARASPTAWSSRSSGRGEQGPGPAASQQGPPVGEPFPRPHGAEFRPAPHTVLCATVCGRRAFSVLFLKQKLSHWLSLLVTLGAWRCLLQLEEL